jgi:NADH-quinone oxidoreductase chain G
MVRIFVNNIAFYVKKDISVLEALSFLGLRIPRFCYHESLSIAGNCRICLVEVDSALKLVASCAQPIMANLQIFSNTTKVLKTRENILESLLINHPLDCPICDQAGECDLQDQSKVFGGIFSRHIFAKRGVENKIIDPCIKTIMTRCIHCTRCVRFAAEVTGKQFLGTLNRGRFTEIGGFISHFQDSSEVSGNVIDLCPVGALTAKPYAFKARPWELRSIETIDLTDGLGSNIYVNLKELDIISVLPKNNPQINGQWISNKARFYIDALQRYRITSAWTKSLNNQRVDTLVQPLTLLQNLLTSDKGKLKQTFLVNEDIDMNTLRLLKKLESAQPGKFDLYNTSASVNQSNYYYSHNNKIIDLENANTSCFVLLATNVRTECAVMNIKLRIKAKSKRINALSFGQRMEPTFPVKFINITASLVLNVIEGKVKGFSKNIFLKAKPIFLIGESFFQRINWDKNALINHLSKYNSNNVTLILNKGANTESINFLNVKPLSSRNLEKNNGYIYCCSLRDSVKLRSVLDKSNSTSVWLHTHGSQIASACDFILPILSHLEAEGIFINLEKRPQKSIKMLENGSPSTVYSLLELVTIIKELLNVNLSNKNSNLELTPFFYMDELVKNGNLFDQLTSKFTKLSLKQEKTFGLYSNYPFKPILSDYYRTNSYAPYSLNMTNYSTKKRLNNNILLNLMS